MSEPTNTPPAGVVGIYVDHDGRVIASASDFNQSGIGGCTLAECQKMRVRGRLAHEVVNAYCSNVVSDALDTYECENIVKKLKGKMVFVAIGHPETDAERLNG